MKPAAVRPRSRAGRLPGFEWLEIRALLERAVDKLLQGRTAIIIAHRLETVRRADDILVLKDGLILEHGPRAALVRDANSHFARLLRAGNQADLDVENPDDPEVLEDALGDALEPQNIEPEKETA